MHNLILYVLIIVSFFLSSCDSLDKSSLPKTTEELVVLSVNRHDTFYQKSEIENVGFEFDLAKRFAKELNKEIKFIIVPDVKKIRLLLESNQAHLAVGINVTDKNKKSFSFGPKYLKVQPKVAYNTNFSRPENIKDLEKKNIEIVSGSSHVELLSKARLKIPDLRWTEMNLSVENLLARLSEGSSDHVIANSLQINVAKNYYPNLGIAVDFGKVKSRAWAFPLNIKLELQEKAQNFFKRIKDDGTLSRLLDRYYGHTERLGKDDVKQFLLQTRVLLPDLRNYFYEAEEITKLDWRLIAALAYQESHWNREAISSTNVRGIMMLTEETAERMNVTDRLDPRQSILAGARYLSILKETLPSRILEPDRTWIALAAYNQGYGHIEDARILAQSMKLSPDNWVDIKKSLPLLSNSKYFKKLKYGYARGGEAVHLAESVRAYYGILMKYEAPYN